MGVDTFGGHASAERVDDYAVDKTAQPKSSTRNRVESIVEPAVQAPLELVWTIISFCWRRIVKAKDVGKAGLAGWRGTIADKAAPPVAARTPVDEDSVRAAIGALFFVLSLVYILGSIRRALAGL